MKHLEHSLGLVELDLDMVEGAFSLIHVRRHLVQLREHVAVGFDVRLHRANARGPARARGGERGQERRGLEGKRESKGGKRGERKKREERTLAEHQICSGCLDC